MGKTIHHTFSLLAICSLIMMALGAYAQETDSPIDLLTQIQALQSRTHIQISGQEKIQNADKVILHGTIEQQIQQLFASYNHIVSRNNKGKVERIVIVNKKEKSKTDRIVLPVNREGNHFIVQVALSGDGRNWQTLDMVIDTGADIVVLPESLIDPLGLTGSQFTQAKMQTANGMADAKIGLLKELRIAGETIENVEATFIADQLLGGNKLLGMSVLGLYQMNIDDDAQLITLIKK